MVTTRSNQASDPSNTAESNLQSSSFSPSVSAWPDPDPLFPSNPGPMSNTGPQPVLPTTGGPTVIGIPLGGNMYLPVTGEPPIIGIPLFP
jgi:hypothetical protein